MSALLAATLAQRAAGDGAVPVAAWMAACNASYYATAPGPGRDFATAPGMTQAFGELLGLWMADLWVRAGQPAHARVAELGPGRGTMLADALRAARAAGFAPASVELVETSPALRAEQAARLPGARWYAHIEALPDRGPLLLLANEFLDALPVRQLVRSGGQWRERCVAWDAATGRGRPVAGAAVDPALVPAELRAAPDGALYERPEAAAALVAGLGRRLVAGGGAALFIDYGHEGPALGETLQAVRAGTPADPFSAPGQADLSAHVDFAAIAAAARAAGCVVHGPVPQGPFLARLGLHLRTAALARANPAAAPALRAAAARLTDAAQMGALFKALAITAPGWPVPAGLA